MSDFLSLPNELQAEILGHLDYISLIRCSTVSKALHSLVTTSSDLQYCIELSINGMERVPGSIRPLSELVTELRQRRHTWDHLRWSGPIEIPISGRCKAYELVGGVFAKTSGQDILFVHLPSQNTELRTHHKHDLGFPVRDFAMDPSMDLVVILEENDLYIASPEEHEVWLHFRTIEENKPHPLAKNPLIKLSLPADDVVGNALDSATLFLHGDVFCFLINFGSMVRVIIWNWQSGTMLYDSSSDPSNPTLPLFAADFCLLGRDSFLVLDSEGPGSLCLYHFSPTSPGECIPVAKLMLPPISPNHLVSNVTVHSGQYEGTPTNSDYRTNHDTRIHVIGLQYRKRFEGRDTTVMFSLFVPNEHLAQYFPTSTALSWTPPRLVTWDEWGPANTRLMSRNVPVNWLRYVHGRMVACEFRGDAMMLLDFNVKPSCKSGLATPHKRDKITVIRSSEGSRTRSPFLNDVRTALPYRSIKKQDQLLSSDYMIDADHIIGIELGSGMTSMSLLVYVLQPKEKDEVRDEASW